MVHAVYAWLRNLVCFSIFLTLILHLLPRENYQKYVRFFAGMLLMILVFSPVLSLLGEKEALLQKISQAEFFQDMDNIKLDTKHLQQTQKEVYVKEYERAIEMDVARMAEGKQLLARQVAVRLSDSYQVESIAMEVEEEEAALSEMGQSYQKTDQLRQELMEFYQLQEGQIEIAVTLF